MKMIITFISIIICLNISAQNVGIGTVTPAARLHIKGNADTSQLVIDAHSTQSNFRPLIRLRKSDGSDLLWIHSDDSSNIFIGKNTGRSNAAFINAKANTFIGFGAGYANFTGSGNTALGLNALSTNVGGREATAIGYNAMQYAFNSGISVPNYNVAVGFEALRGSTDASANYGSSNTALGYQSLLNNTTGVNNTASGTLALSNNTTGSYNTAIGSNALLLNTTGISNTALGLNALNANTTGNYNVASGQSALRSNTTGNNNIATGVNALYFNTIGFSNTALGTEALYGNTGGFGNTGTGHEALHTNTIGGANTATGYQALFYNNGGYNNTAVGYGAGGGSLGINFTECTFLGSNSSLSVARSNVTMLGAFISNAQCTGNNQVLLGNTAISQIRAQVTGITAYSEQFIGFLAQDVEKAAKESGFDFPGIDVPRNDKEVYSLRYVDFIMPMVKAMQEQQVMIETLQKQVVAAKTEVPVQIEKQQQQIKLLNKTIEQQNEINNDLINRLKNLETFIKK